MVDYPLTTGQNSERYFSMKILSDISQRMESLITKTREIKHVLSENEDSLPECLLQPEPVNDFYSSDDDLGKDNNSKERMLIADIVNSSEINLWEVAYYLQFLYESYKSDKELIGISAKDLLTESLKFCYGDGLPNAYEKISGLDENASWEEIGSSLHKTYENKHVGNTWLKKKFYLDYSEAEDDDIRRQTDTIFECMMLSDYIGDEIVGACNLAARMNQVLGFLRKDKKVQCEDKSKSIEDKSVYENDKHDQLKGLLCEIMAYVDISVLYNGEGTLDFMTEIKDRIGKVSFKVKPDVIAYRIPGLSYPLKKKSPNEPLLVCEVLGPSTDRVMKKAEKISKQSSESDENNIPPFHSCTSETPKTKRKVSGLSDKLSSLHIAVKKESSFRKLRTAITLCGPATVNTEHAADKLYGQLALQLFGALERRKVARIAQKHMALQSGDEEDEVLGLFVMDEFVFLVKMIRALDYDENYAYEFKTKLLYAKNLWFNLNKPNDRMAFLSFLFHYNKIQRSQMNTKWSKWFRDTHNGMNPQEYFDKGSFWNKK